MTPGLDLSEIHNLLVEDQFLEHGIGTPCTTTGCLLHREKRRNHSNGPPRQEISSEKIRALDAAEEIEVVAEWDSFGADILEI